MTIDMIDVDFFNLRIYQLKEKYGRYLIADMHV